jgi:hypothetical protein
MGFFDSLIRGVDPRRKATLTDLLQQNLLYVTIIIT